MLYARTCRSLLSVARSRLDAMPSWCSSSRPCCLLRNSCSGPAPPPTLAAPLFDIRSGDAARSALSYF